MRGATSFQATGPQRSNCGTVVVGQLDSASHFSPYLIWGSGRFSEYVALVVTTLV